MHYLRQTQFPASITSHAYADRRHSLALTVSYVLHKNWTLSSNFILASGTSKQNGYCPFDPATGKPIPVEVSFVPIIPSLTFNVRF